MELHAQLLCDCSEDGVKFCCIAHQGCSEDGVKFCCIAHQDCSEDEVKFCCIAHQGCSEDRVKFCCIAHQDCSEDGVKFCRIAHQDCSEDGVKFCRIAHQGLLQLYVASFSPSLVPGLCEVEKAVWDVLLAHSQIKLEIRVIFCVTGTSPSGMPYRIAGNFGGFGQMAF